MNLFKSLFGTTDFIKEGVKLIDEAFYTDEEKAQDKQKILEMKAQHKLQFLGAYSAYKKTQRYIALSFTFVFIFIMINGVLGSLYGVVDMDSVKRALDFANEMWLGQSMAIILSFYFGGGFVESFKGVGNGKK